MNKFLLLILVFTTLFSYAQESEIPATETDSTNTERPRTVNPSPWSKKGKGSLLINQTAFNNDWVGGGVSNLAINSNFEYAANYKKGVWAWDNKLLLAYGLTKLKDEGSFRKTSDNIEFSSVVGKNTGSGFWSYSGYFNFKSQFAKGYNFKKDGAKTLISSGFSPAYFQLGPGLFWKKNDNFKINIAPATTRLIIVDEIFTREKDAFGVKKGETELIEFGASIAASNKFTLVKNVTVENILNLYSNYLSRVSNIDINYTLNMESKINNHMSANFIFQTIYDDDTVGAFQVREVIAIGVNYDL